jgi:hypothetical protein
MMTLRQAIIILNAVGYGYSERWRETAEGNIEAEGMRLSRPEAIAAAEYWGPLLLQNPEAVVQVERLMQLLESAV